MKATVEDLSPVRKKLSVFVPEDEVMSEIEEAYQQLGRNVRIPGFRAGKAPRAILEKRFGATVEADVYQSLLQKTFAQALREHSLDAVAVPDIDEPKRRKGEGFSYTASVEVKPRIEPKNYTGVKLRRSAVDVTEEQIGGVLARLRESQAVLREREGAARPQEGDFVALAVQAADADGNPTSEEEPKEQIQEVGAETLHPALHKALLEMSVGETRTVPIETKPAADAAGEPEGGRKVFLRVTLKAIKEKILPVPDDGFAKSVGPFNNMAELRERIVKDLRDELQEKARAELARDLLAHLVRENPAELPDSLVRSELGSLIESFWNNLRRAGVKRIPEEYSEAKLSDKLRVDAERRVHEQLLIEAISRKEGLSVEEAEVAGQIRKMAAGTRTPASEFRAYLEKTGRLDGLRFRLLAQKTVDFLLSRATIK